jgi:hypothetical protein
MTRIDSERSGNAIGTVESPSNSSPGEHPVFTRTDHYLLHLAGRCDAGHLFDEYSRNEHFISTGQLTEKPTAVNAHLLLRPAVPQRWSQTPTISPPRT